MHRLVVVCLVLVAWPAPAHAYLDPGTGSMILQGLLAAASAAAVTVGLYWRRFLAFFGIGTRPEVPPSGEEEKPKG